MTNEQMLQEIVTVLCELRMAMREIQQLRARVSELEAAATAECQEEPAAESPSRT